MSSSIIYFSFMSVIITFSSMYPLKIARVCSCLFKVAENHESIGFEVVQTRPSFSGRKCHDGKPPMTLPFSPVFGSPSSDRIKVRMTYSCVVLYCVGLYILSSLKRGT